MTQAASKVTLHDIAACQGVSHTTVSFVLRGRNMGISTEKCEGILRDAIRLKYRTRPDQRIDNQKRKVLLLAPLYNEVYGPETYVSRLVSSLCATKEESGVEITVQASTDRNIIRSLYKGICEDQAEIVIPVSMGQSNLAMVAELSPVPVISIDLWADLECSVIGFDDEWIGSEAARQFCSAGHRHAAALYPTSHHNLRIASFCETFAELGGNVTKIIFDAAFDRQAVYQKLRKTLPEAREFSCLFCGDDSLAMAAMQAMYDAGLSIPDDISLIGCDDHVDSSYSHPSLSTFRMDEVTHSQQLIAEIHRLTAGAENSKRITNKADFISRQSVRQV